MTQEQHCDWEISTSLLFERNSVAISQKEQRTAFRQSHLGKGLFFMEITPSHKHVYA